MRVALSPGVPPHEGTQQPSQVPPGNTRLQEALQTPSTSSAGALPECITDARFPARHTAATIFPAEIHATYGNPLVQDNCNY